MADDRRPVGTCSECPELLYNRAAKTCGKKCRQARARRIRAAQGHGKRAYPPHLKHLSNMDDIAHEVAVEELRPIVREALTEDVLRGVSRLIGLTGKMVDALEEDLESSDKILRQRAYSLLAKYTLGNPSVAPQPEQPDAQPMQVVFHLPRPGDAPALDAAAPIDVELRECSECHEHKPTDQFVDESDRCTACHELVLEQITNRFAQ